LDWIGLDYPRAIEYSYRRQWDSQISHSTDAQCETADSTEHVRVAAETHFSDSDEHLPAPLWSFRDLVLSNKSSHYLITYLFIVNSPVHINNTFDNSAVRTEWSTQCHAT